MAGVRYVNADTREGIRRAAEELQNDGVIVFPTDTVYGLMAAVSSGQAYRKLFAIKQRPVGSPIALLAHYQSPVALEATGHASVNPELSAMFARGEVTVVFVHKVISSLHEAVAAFQPGPPGIRIPADERTRSLLSASGGCLWATSANRTGEPASTSESEIRQWIDSCDIAPDLAAVSKSSCNGMPSAVARLRGSAIEWIR